MILMCGLPLLCLKECPRKDAHENILTWWRSKRFETIGAGKRAVTEMAVAVTVVTSERRETEMNKMEKDEVQIKHEWLSRPSEALG